MTLDEHASRTRDMVPHTATLTRYAQDAHIILELGVRTGVSTWALLDGLSESGHLVSVDIDDVWEQLPDRITKDPRWRFVNADDRDGLPIKAADLVFIDTSHEYHHTLAELEMVGALNPRWILLHDYALPDVQDAIHGWLSRDRRYRLALLESSEWMLAGLERR